MKKGLPDNMEPLQEEPSENDLNFLLDAGISLECIKWEKSNKGFTTQVLAEAIRKMAKSQDIRDIVRDEMSAFEEWEKTFYGTESSPDTEDQTEEKPTLQVVSLRDLMTMDIPEPSYLVDDWIPDVGLVIVSGASKIGKSWFCQLLALMVASGRPFLNQKTHKAGVLYLDLEDKMNDSKKRFKHLLYGLKMKEAPEGFNLVFQSPTVDEGGLDALDDAIKQYPDTRLVVIDVVAVFRSFTSGKGLNSYERDYKDYRPLKEWADSRGICLLLITHNNKTVDEDDRFNQISGSSGQLAVSDAAIVLYKDKREDINAILEITGRSVKGGKFIVRRDSDTCIWEFVDDENNISNMMEEMQYRQNPIVQTVLTLLERAPDHIWKGKAQHLLDAGHLYLGQSLAPTTQTLSSNLRKLEAQLLQFDGVAVDHKSGRFTIYYRSDNGFEDLGTDETGETESVFQNE